MKTKTDSIAELIDFIYQNGYEIKIEGQKPLQMCTRIPLNSIPISEKKSLEFSLKNIIIYKDMTVKEIEFILQDAKEKIEKLNLYDTEFIISYIEKKYSNESNSNNLKDE